jgi:hypothetical protein
VPDLPFTDLAGQAHRLSGAAGPHGLVIAVTSATCPLSKRYLPSLAALEADLRADGIGLILVNPLASETPAEIRAQLAGHAFTAPYVHDADRRLTTALGARTTTELFLLDRTRTLIYRGALDDQYDLARNLPEPRQPHLRRAGAALRQGEPPASPVTRCAKYLFGGKFGPLTTRMTLRKKSDVCRGGDVVGPTLTLFMAALWSCLAY